MLRTNHLQKSLGVLLQVQKKLKESIFNSYINQQNTIQFQTTNVELEKPKQKISNQSTHSHFYESGKKQKQRLNKSNKVKSNQVQKYSLNIEITNLKNQIKQLKKHVKFLEKMNQNLKLQILNFTKKSTQINKIETVQKKNCITHKSEIEYLKKINILQSIEIQNLRKIKSQATHELLPKQNIKDIYTYITPERIIYQKKKSNNYQTFKTEYSESTPHRSPQKRTQSANIIQKKCVCFKERTQNPKNRKHTKFF